MVSEKTLYWAAVGLMVLVLGNHFAKRYEGCLSEISSVTTQQLADGAGHVLAMAQIALGRTPSFSGSEFAMARVQGRMASLQAVVARQQAACARVEARRAQMTVMRQFENMQIGVTCPRQRLQVVVPAIPTPAIATDGTI